MASGLSASAPPSRAAFARGAWLAFLFAVAFAPNAWAADDYDERDVWVPSVSIEWSVIGHKGQGDINGTTIVGPRDDISVVDANRFADFLDDRIEDVLSSRQEILSMLYGSDFEIMSPRFFKSDYAPRAFLSVSLFATQTLEVLLARRGDPGTLRFPPADSPIVVGERAVLGNGSQISIQHKDPQVHSSLGLAFTTHPWGETIRIKPAFVYSRVPLQVNAKTNRVVRLREDASATLDDPTAYRFILLQEKADEVYHGAGASLEIEYDTEGRLFDQFDVTLYMEGQATHLFGDMETELVGSNPDYPDEQVFYKYTQDRWIYRAGVGIRLRWLPGAGAGLFR